MLIVDGPPGRVNKDARYPALPLLHERLNPGAHVFLDDATRPDERRILTQWLAEFPDLRLIRHVGRMAVMQRGTQGTMLSPVERLTARSGFAV